MGHSFQVIALNYVVVAKWLDKGVANRAGNRSRMASESDGDHGELRKSSACSMGVVARCAKLALTHVQVSLRKERLDRSTI